MVLGADANPMVGTLSRARSAVASTDTEIGSPWPYFIALPIRFETTCRAGACPSGRRRVLARERRRTFDHASCSHYSQALPAPERQIDSSQPELELPRRSRELFEHAAIEIG